MNIVRHLMEEMNRAFPAPTSCCCVQAIYGKFVGQDLMCNETHEIAGKEWACTRENGHTGPHVACGLGCHKVAEWPNDKDST